MTNPFPGMNPFLEERDSWTEFHDDLVFHLGSQLRASLPPGYAARFGRRVELVLAGRTIVPGVAVWRTDEPVGQAEAAAARDPDPAVRIAVHREEAVERFVEILRLPGGELVTVLELASPTNKLDSRERTAYLEKQQAVLRSPVHLVEIDLLRGGEHWAAVPEAAAQRHQPYDYLACVSRSTDRSVYECYFRTLREPLPAIAVPLQQDDPDVTLDIQGSLNQTFEDGRYAASLDYRRVLSPPLRAEDQAWLQARLRAAGLLDP